MPRFCDASHRVMRQKVGQEMRQSGKKIDVAPQICDKWLWRLLAKLFGHIVCIGRLLKLWSIPGPVSTCRRHDTDYFYLTLKCYET